jgi:hypothetical protein
MDKTPIVDIENRKDFEALYRKLAGSSATGLIEDVGVFYLNKTGVYQGWDTIDRNTAGDSYYSVTFRCKPKEVPSYHSFTINIYGTDAEAKAEKERIETVIGYTLIRPI